MCRAVLLALFPAALLAQQASIEGVTVDKSTGEPISGVHISLITGVMNSVTSAYGALSDRTGHFSIATIRPGTYLMICERTGYLHVISKGIPNVSVKPGEHLTNFKIELTPRAILSGRVLDENGDPMQEISVEAVPVSSDIGTSMMQAMTDAISRSFGTDDRGEFRLTVVPGKYYLKAASRGGPNVRFGGNPTERRNDGSTLPPYGTTFYPSIPAQTRATVVEAIGGKDISGLEIRLIRQQAISISGIVTGAPENGPRPTINAQQIVEGKSGRGESRNASAAPDGKFSITGLQPGRYRVWASYSSGKTRLGSLMTELNVDSGDTPLTLTLVSMAEVTGKVVIEGDAPETAMPKRWVRFDAIEAAGNRSERGQTDAENNFQIPGLRAGKYRVKVEDLPENAFVKSLEADGTAIASNVYEIAEGARGGRVKVMVSRGGATLSGRVLDSDGNRLLTPLALVVLTKDGDAEDFEPAEVAADSKYTVKGIRPGKYHLLAVNPFDMDFMNEQEWLKSLRGLGEEIEIKEGDRITKDVKMLPKK